MGDELELRPDRLLSWPRKVEPRSHAVGHSPTRAGSKQSPLDPQSADFIQSAQPLFVGSAEPRRSSVDCPLLWIVTGRYPPAVIARTPRCVGMLWLSPWSAQAATASSGAFTLGADHERAP